MKETQNQIRSNGMKLKYLSFLTFKQRQNGMKLLKNNPCISLYNILVIIFKNYEYFNVDNLYYKYKL